jgi:hypothetical protein
MERMDKAAGTLIAAVVLIALVGLFYYLMKL